MSDTRLRHATTWPLPYEIEQVEYVLRQALKHNAPEAVFPLTRDELLILAATCNACRSMMKSPWREKYEQARWEHDIEVGGLQAKLSRLERDR